MFQKNAGSNAFPLKAVFMETEAELIFPAQVMFVVPKRNFKKAHDRNKLKRRMREIYRLNKQTFYDSIDSANKITHHRLYLYREKGRRICNY